MANFNYSATLRNIIINDSELKNYLDNEIYPIVAEANTKFPFIVYRRSGYYKGNPNKDDYDDKFTVELAILSESYQVSVAILNRLTKVLDDYDNGRIAIQVTNSNEDFQDDTYIQKVNLDIKYNND